MRACVSPCGPHHVLACTNRWMLRLLRVHAVIQFGYASLFVVAFPLAPLLALINNYFEIRVDSFKLLTNAQRPIPRGAQDMGTLHAVTESPTSPPPHRLLTSRTCRCVCACMQGAGSTSWRRLASWLC